MTAYTLTTEENGLKVVARESLGKDSITANAIRYKIGEAIYPRYKLSKMTELNQSIWDTVIEVADIITQTVSLEETGDARWPENLVLPEPSNHAACVAFYDVLMDSPKRYKTLLLKAVEAVNADTPNLNGGQSGKESASAPVFASSLKAL